MNVIKHGDPKKVEETKRKKDLKRFRCHTCGALWDASISKNECRFATYGDCWISDCPEEYCDGTGKEEKQREIPTRDCFNCKWFDFLRSDLFNKCMKSNRISDTGPCADFEEKV